MRAAKVCGHPDCPNLEPCPTHQRKPWQGNGRHGRMRSGSKEQRINRAVLRNHGYICHVCGQPGADEVDHVIPLSAGGADGYDNRLPIHSTPCHAEKTQREAKEARCPTR